MTTSSYIKPIISGAVIGLVAGATTGAIAGSVLGNFVGTIFAEKIDRYARFSDSSKNEGAPISSFFRKSCMLSGALAWARVGAEQGLKLGVIAGIAYRIFSSV